jgi:hypothetical protein
VRLGQPCTSQFPEFALASSESSPRSYTCFLKLQAGCEWALPGHSKKLDQSRVRIHESDCADHQTGGEGEAQDCSRLVGVPSSLDSDLVAATLPSWATEQRNQRLMELKERMWCGSDVDCHDARQKVSVSKAEVLEAVEHF